MDRTGLVSFSGKQRKRCIKRAGKGAHTMIAFIIKKELTADQASISVAVPEFKVIISADNLEQVKEIKKLHKIAFASP